MAQLIDGGAGDVMIFDERIGGFSRAVRAETERLSAAGCELARVALPDIRLPENSV